MAKNKKQVIDEKTLIIAFRSLIKKSNKKKIIYGIAFYFLNMLSLCAILGTAIISVYFLAGNNKHYPEGVINPYRTDFWNKVPDNYILFTAIINSFVAFISGLISFFVINTKYNFIVQKQDYLN
ncbi:DUF4231 domain-containing protein [Mycoplasma leonicaptivi]|uniref:DUF4231 domain-containing protein n=1 Tax=Mycoplasma leonicaptivi TaxID=36742 RepID=UPI000687FB57|nr:DUF4231 domain-containing protein [Mycoplasma leonicaptivi]